MHHSMKVVPVPIADNDETQSLFLKSDFGVITINGFLKSLCNCRRNHENS